MNIDIEKLNEENRFAVLCEYAKELNTKLSKSHCTLDKNIDNNEIYQTYQKIMTFYDELNYEQKIILLQTMLDLSEYFNKEQLNLLLSSNKLDGLDTALVEAMLCKLKSKELEILLTDTSYTRNEIMGVVYEEVNGCKPLNNQELNQWAGNHWNDIVHFMKETLDLDMEEYKVGAYSIPILDAIIIIAYACLICKRKQSDLISKLNNDDYLNINVYDLDCFIKSLILLLKKECKRKFGNLVDKNVLKNNIKYVDDRMKLILRTRDTERQLYLRNKQILTSYHSDIKKFIKKYFAAKFFNKEILLKKQKVIKKLELAYENAFYDFILKNWFNEEKNIKENDNLRWISNPNIDFYYDDKKQKLVCEHTNSEVKLVIPTYVSDDDTIMCHVYEQKTAESIINLYYKFHMHKFVYQMILRPSKSMFNISVEWDGDLLKSVLKKFNECVKYTANKLYKEFCNQLKII